MRVTTSRRTIPLMSATPPTPSAPATSVTPLEAVTIVTEPQTQTGIPTTLTPEQRAARLKRADDTHRLNIEWVRALDSKIGPVLAVSGALSGVVVFLLGPTVPVTGHPYIHSLLFCVLLLLFMALFKSLQTVSPSLNLGRLGENRHEANKTSPEPTSHLFFGQIARYGDNAEDGTPRGGEAGFLEAARARFADEEAMLDDLLRQTCINARIATKKSEHIAFAVRWLFAAIVALVLIAGLYIAGL